MDEYYLCPWDDINNPKYRFYLLYKNGRCFFKEFVDSLVRATDLDELYSIVAVMDKVDTNNLPPSKYRHITGGRHDRKDVYEFKSKHLRLYAIKCAPDYYMITGGYKKTQDKDIAKVFRHFNDLPDKIEVRTGEETDKTDQDETA